MTGDLPTHHAGVAPDPRRDHHTLDALGDPSGDLLPVRPGHHDPTSGFGPGVGRGRRAAYGAALPPPGRRLRRRTRRLLRRRPGPASLRSPCQPPPRAEPTTACPLGRPPSPPDPSNTATLPAPILATCTPHRHTHHRRSCMINCYDRLGSRPPHDVPGRPPVDSSCQRRHAAAIEVVLATLHPLTWTFSGGGRDDVLDIRCSSQMSTASQSASQMSKRGSVGHRSEAQAGQLSNGIGGGGGEQPWSSSVVGGVNRVRNRS